MFKAIKDYFKTHYLQIALVLFGLAIHIGAILYRTQVCAVHGCDSYFHAAYLAPLREAGLIIAAMTAPLLVLPKRYFRPWFLYFFLPLATLTFINTMQQSPSSSNFWYGTSRAQELNDLPIPYFILTLIFVAFNYVYSRVNKYKLLFIVSFLVIALLVVTLPNPYVRNWLLGFIS